MSYLRICINNTYDDSLLSKNKYTAVTIKNDKNVLWYGYLPHCLTKGSVEFLVINKPTKIYIDIKVPVVLYLNNSVEIGYGPKQFLFDFTLD